MFVPLWLVFLASGTLMALLALGWGVQTRQFEDQDRARYLPLVGLSPEELSRPALEPRRVAERWAMGLVLFSGGLVLVSTLWVVLRHL